MSNMSEAPVSSHLVKTFGVSIWCSFMSACVATMLFFATFDPQVLSEVATFPMPLSPEAGYTIGFFLFWFLLMVNSFLVLLLTSASRSKHR